MNKRSRRNHSAAFKGKVALAARKVDETLAQPATQFDLIKKYAEVTKRRCGKWA
jgi:hypothetical protein